MPKREPQLEPNRRRIIVEEQFHNWAAWFEDHPETGFGGDSPGTAVDRLWGWWIATREAAASDEG